VCDMRLVMAAALIASVEPSNGFRGCKHWPSVRSRSPHEMTA
jgi:hypothetical protein